MGRRKQPLRKSEKKQTVIKKTLWTNGDMHVGIDPKVGNPMLRIESETHTFMSSIMCSSARHKRCKQKGICEYMEPSTDEGRAAAAGILYMKWLAMSPAEQRAALLDANLAAKKGLKNCRRVKLIVEED